MAEQEQKKRSLEEIEAGLNRLYQSAQPDSRFLNQLEDQLLSQTNKVAWWRRWSEAMSRFGKTTAWGAAALLLALALIYGLNHFIPVPAVETSTPVIPAKTPVPEATQSSTPSTTATLERPSATPSLAPPSATPEPVVCLDESAKPLALPARTVPLEVRFISDGNIFAWQEGAAEAWQITSTGDARTFSFSPDGDVIAFERAVGPEEAYTNELWAANRDGSNLRQLLSLETLNELGGEPPESEHPYVYEIYYGKWVDGTRQLQVHIARNYLAIGGCCDEIGSYQIDADNGELEKLPETAPEPGELGLLSPDGKLVALVGNTSLSLMEVESGNVRENIFSYPYVPNPEGGGLAGPVLQWAHDSQSLLAITYNPEALFEGEQLFHTWRVPVDGTPAEQLARFEGSPFQIHISPDQQYFNYTSAEMPNSNNRQLHLAKFDGSRDVVYAEGYLNYFWTWAPDSDHFVYGASTTKKAVYGSLCSGDQPLLQQEFLPVEQVRWVDNTHFLFVYAPHEDWIKELRLGEVGGSSMRIGPFNGYYALYEYDQDPGALGWLFAP